MARRRKTAAQPPAPPSPVRFMVSEKLGMEIMAQLKAQDDAERAAASSSSANSSDSIQQPPEKQARLEQHHATGSGASSMCGASDADTNNSVALLEDRVRGLEERQQQMQQVIAQQSRDMAALHALVNELHAQLAAARERQAASMDSMREQIMQHVTDSQQQTIQQLQQLGQGPMQPRGGVAPPAPKQQTSVVQPQQQPSAPPPLQQQQRQQTSVVQPQQQPSAPPPLRQQQREQPTPRPAPPPATFKEAVGGAPPAPQDQPMADAPGRRPRPPFPRGADLVGKAQVLRSFILKGREVPALVKAGPGATMGRLAAFLTERLPSEQPWTVVDAVRRGPDAAPCIFFEVATLAQADSLIQRRCALKGTGTTIFEALTAEEQRQQAALWPAFLAAKRAGTPAQFKRAVLIVGGQRVRPAAS